MDLSTVSERLLGDGRVKGIKKYATYGEVAGTFSIDLWSCKPRKLLRRNEEAIFQGPLETVQD